FMRIARRSRERARKSHALATFFQKLALKDKTFAVRKRTGFAKYHRRIMKKFAIDHGGNRGILDPGKYTRCVLHVASKSREQVVDINHHCLTFHYSAPCDCALPVFKFGCPLLFVR